MSESGKEPMTDADSRVPAPMEAEEVLAWAEAQNPGPWADHCRVAARAARTIAAASGMDTDKAYALGLLHDVGRYEGVRDLHHVVAGYRLMEEKGFGGAARICLTHSFSVQDIAAYNGKNDCTEAESAWMREALAAVEYDDCDRLVQLCDSICSPQGVCLLQVRLMDVVRRHGLNAYILQKWDAYFELKRYFDEKCGGNIYDLFYDEVREVSFR